MNTRIKDMLDYYVVKKAHHEFRQQPTDKYRYAVTYSEEGLDDVTRSLRRLKDFLAEEIPVVIPKEKIVLMRTVLTIPEIFTAEEYEEIGKKHYQHEESRIANICPDYTLLLNCGFDAKRKEIQNKIKEFESEGNAIAVKYEKSFAEVIEILCGFMMRYADEAERVGNIEKASQLRKLTSDAPETFEEALQLFRFIQFGLWGSSNFQIVLGRFDQYMFKFFDADMKSGRLNYDSALELLEDFFISLNKDTDLYPGIQQGDNGQAMVLGGLNKDGSESFNELSDLCLQASLELKLIDPKINLRVNKKTSLSEYIRGTELTKVGIGFPQYENDDVVFKALRTWGYDDDDIYDYVVAACWELIIPGYGMDIVNVDSMNFPAAIIKAVDRLKEFNTYDEFMAGVKEEIFKACDALRNIAIDVYFEPSPLLSLIMCGCVENGSDIQNGGKYNNYGFHGTGISTAVDSIAAVKKYVYEDKKISREEMINLINSDFEGHEELANELRYEGPKFGNDDDDTDEIAVKILDWFADALEGHRNDRGGIYRGGTASAMYYIWYSENMKATPDGRRKGEQFAANYSPSIFTRLDGPFSIIKSFTKPHLYRTCNGGPLTIELSDTMFKNEEAVEKTARFVKTFIDLGGHEMQLNAVNRDTMIDAKAHPENHRNLIVRVWGWSGYFVELDECYQDQIIKRMELVV